MEVTSVEIVFEGFEGDSALNLAMEPEIEITYEEDPTIYCRTCGTSFSSSKEFEDHNIEVHTRKKKCPICKMLFQRQDHLRRHVLTVHSSENTTTCPVCDMECEEQSILLKHLENCRPTDNKYHCRRCEFVADSLALLQDHETCHSTKYQCQECSASFKRPDHLSRHVKSQHLLESVQCDLCQKAFKRRDHMLRHVREKHDLIYKDGNLVTHHKTGRRPKSKK